MATQHGKSGTVLVGAYNLSSMFNDMTIGRAKQAVQTTTYGDTSHDFIEGLREGRIELTGLFDGVADKADDRLHTAFVASTLTPVTVSPSDTTAGNKAFIAQVWNTDYNVTSPVEDVVATGATMLADDRGVEVGHWHANLAQQSGALEYSSIDNGASSANGGVGTLHVTQFNGVNATVKVRDSADNVTFADKLSFATVTGLTSEYKTVTGTINRYTRIELSGTFTTITLAGAFARR